MGDKAGTDCPSLWSHLAEKLAWWEDREGNNAPALCSEGKDHKQCTAYTTGAGEVKRRGEQKRSLKLRQNHGDELSKANPDSPAMRQHIPLSRRIPLKLSPTQLNSLAQCLITVLGAY